MTDKDAHETAEEERDRRDHEAEARERDPHERRDGEGDDTAESGGPPANVQAGTNTGS